jgi:hypothetical protein
MLQHQMRADLLAGGERRAVALGRQTAGAAIWGTGVLLARAGAITGSGPKNPKMRDEWYAAGNKPYHLYVPDGSGGKIGIDYSRIEQLATAFGMMADATHMLGELDDKEGEDLAVAGITALGNAVTSRTWLQGISQAMEMITSGQEYKTKQFLASAVTSFVPNLFRQTDPDPYFREVRSIQETIQQRSWLHNQSLEPRRNIFGQPVAKSPDLWQRSFNPVSVTRLRDDRQRRMMEELLSLDAPLTQPSRKRNGVDWSDRDAWDPGTHQSPYDRLLELLDQNKVGGKNLEVAMMDLVESDQWKDASAGTDAFPGGRRKELADRLVKRHVRNAEIKVMEEYPEFREFIRQQKIDKAVAQRGIDADAALFGGSGGSIADLK